MIRRIAGVVLLLAGVLRAQTTWPTTPDTTSTLLFDKNLFGTVLTAPVSSSATTMTVQSTAGLAQNMEVLIDFEAVKITSISSLTLTVQRGFDSSVPAPHGLLSKVYRLPGAAYHNFLASAIFAMQITPFNVVLSVPSGACSPNNKIVWVPGGSIYGCVSGFWQVISGGGGGSAVWGGISGLLSNQTDLQSALNAKQNTLTLPLPVANGGTGTATPSLIAGTNVTITGSFPSQTINATVGGAVSSVFGRTGTVVAQTGDYTAAQVSNAARTDAGNTFGAFSNSFLTSTHLFIPESFAAAPTADADIAFDSGSKTYQFGSNGITLAMAYFIGAPPVVGNCLQFGTNYRLVDAGAPCGSGGGSGTVTHTTGALTSGQLVIGNGGADIRVGNLSGDVGTSGTTTTTLATVNGNVGTFGDSTHVGQFTVDGKGRITAASNVAVSGGGGAASSIAAGPLSGIPATCTAGGVYFATDQPAGQQLYQCIFANTWLQTLLTDSTLVNTAGAFGVDLNQFCRFTNSCTVASFWDYGSASATAPNKKGLAAAIPATCAVGQTYFETDATAGQNLFGCTATNTWTLQGGGSVTTHYGLITNTATTQTIPGTSTATPITFDTNEDLTNSALHSTSGNPQNFVVDATGRWSGACQVTATNDAINFSVIVFINGVAKFNNGGNHTAGAQNVPWSWHLTSGDIVTCQASSAAGFTVSSVGTTFYGFLIH